MSYVTLIAYVNPDCTPEQVRVAAHLANKRSNLASCGGVSVGVRGRRRGISRGHLIPDIDLQIRNGLEKQDNDLRDLRRSKGVVNQRMSRGNASGLPVCVSGHGTVAFIGVSPLASKLISAALPFTGAREARRAVTLMSMDATTVSGAPNRLTRAWLARMD